MHALGSILKILNLASPVVEIIAKLIDAIIASPDQSAAAKKALAAATFEKTARALPVNNSKR